MAAELVATTDIAAGAPISYVVNEVANPTNTVATTLNLSYTVTDCTPYASAFPAFAFNWSSINDVGGGPITALVQDNTTNALIAFVNGGTEYVKVNQGGDPTLQEVEGPFPIDNWTEIGLDGNGNSLSDRMPSGVKAIGRIFNNLSPLLPALDLTGYLAYGIGGNGYRWITTGGIGGSNQPGLLAGGGAGPPGSFNTGVGALSGHLNPGAIPNGWHRFISESGTEIAAWESEHTTDNFPLPNTYIDYWHPAESISSFSSQLGTNIPDDTWSGNIGACAYYKVGGQAFDIMVNSAGDQYMVRESSLNLDNGWSGPFPF